MKKIIISLLILFTVFNGYSQRKPKPAEFNTGIIITPNITFPSNPKEGQFHFDSVTHTPYYYNNTSWVSYPNAIVPFHVFVNTVSGNDVNAEIENPKKPYQTWAAALAALPVDNGTTWTIQFIDTGSVTRNMNAVIPARNLKIVCLSDGGSFNFSSVTTNNLMKSLEIYAPNVNFTHTGATGVLFGNSTAAKFNLVLKDITISSSISGFGGFFQGISTSKESSIVCSNFIATSTQPIGYSGSLTIKNTLTIGNSVYFLGNQADYIDLDINTITKTGVGNSFIFSADGVEGSLKVKRINGTGTVVLQDNYQRSVNYNFSDTAISGITGLQLLSGVNIGANIKVTGQLTGSIPLTIGNISSPNLKIINFQGRIAQLTPSLNEVYNIEIINSTITTTSSLFNHTTYPLTSLSIDQSSIIQDAPADLIINEPTAFNIDIIGRFYTTAASLGTNIAYTNLTPENYPAVAGGGGGFTQEQIEDIAGNLLTTNSEIALTYNDGTPSIAATLVTGGIGLSKLDATIQTSLGKADTALQTADYNNAVNRANHIGAQPIATVTNLQTTLDGKQENLVSGTNIKTVNGNSILGSGNITIVSGSVTNDPYIDWETNTTEAPSADALHTKIESLILGVGTGATPIEHTFTGGETTWNTGVTITDSHQLTLGSGTGIQSLLHRGVDYTWAGSTFTFISGTLPIAAGEVAFYYPNVAVPETYNASETTVSAGGFSGNLSSTDTDVQTALETIDALVLGGGTPTVITNITKYTTFAGLPAVTGTEDDTYAYVTEDTNLDLRGLYAIVGGAWKLLYHFEDLNMPITKVSRNEIDLTQPVVAGTPTGTEEGIINGYQFNISADGLTVAASKYITNFIPVQFGDVLVRINLDRFWFYDADKQLIPWADGIIPYNNDDYCAITSERVKYVRWTATIANQGTTDMIVRNYNTIAGAEPIGWDNFHGDADNYQRNNTRYTYENEGIIFKKPTNNLFDYKKANYGQGFGTTGTASTSNGSTGLIPCKGGLPYALSTGANAPITYWDANKVYISGATDWDGFVTPSTARYFSVQFARTIDWKNLEVYQGIRDRVVNYLEASTETVTEAEENPISVCLISDSIGTEDSTFATESAYATTLREALKFETFHNISVSGKSIGNYQTSINTGRYNTPVADVYVIALGTNDFGYNRAIGTLGDTAATDTFYGSIQDLVEGLVALNANAKIVFFTPIARSTQYTPNAVSAILKDYRDALIAYAVNGGYSYLDLWESGINPFNTQTLTNWFISADGTHPNNAAHKAFLYPKVVQFVKKELKR